MLRAASVLCLLSSHAFGQIETHLTPVVPTPYQNFGYSVAIDEARVVVGARSSSSPGSAHVYELADGVWTEVAELKPLDGKAGDFFGTAVAVDGERALVGATHTSSDYLGAGYLFEMESGAWVQVAKIGSDGSQSNYMGTAVTLAGDEAFVGNITDNELGSLAGAVYVSRRIAGTWQPVQKLQASDAMVGDEFGNAVAVENDVALIGARWDDTVADRSGAVYVFERQQGQWVEVQKLIAPDSNDLSQFGDSIALSNGEALIGAPGDEDFGYRAGACYLFSLQGANWNEIAKVHPVDAKPVDYFGAYVAFDEGRLAVSATRGATQNGSVFVFERPNGQWVQTLELSGCCSSWNQDFGVSVGIDGDLVVGGFHGDSTIDPNVGSAYVWDLTCSGADVAQYCAGKANSESCVPFVDCSGGPPSATSTEPFVVTAHSVLNNVPGLIFYGESGRANVPWLGGVLCVMPPLVRTLPQISGGNPPPDDCSGSYAFDFTSWIASGQDPSLMPGSTVNAQYWYRDAGDPFGSGTTNALEFVVE